jgi:hypothetical protein
MAAFDEPSSTFLFLHVAESCLSRASTASLPETSSVTVTRTAGRGSANVGQRADLHRAFKPLLPVFLRQEGAPGGGGRTQGHLPGRTAGAAAKRLSEFDAGPWGRKYPMIAESWRRNWEQIILLQLSAGGDEEK